MMGRTDKTLKHDCTKGPPITFLPVTLLQKDFRGNLSRVSRVVTLVPIMQLT